VEFLVLFVAVGLGAVVQGSVGFDLALVVVPAMTLVSPEALPATVLLLAMPMASVLAARERHAIYALGLVYLLSGRLLETLGGVGLLFCWCRTTTSRCYSVASSWWPRSRARPTPR
jgi:uncharacterized membrane protein YfcA